MFSDLPKSKYHVQQRKMHRVGRWLHCSCLLHCSDPSLSVLDSGLSNTGPTLRAQDSSRLRIQLFHGGRTEAARQHDTGPWLVGFNKKKKKSQPLTRSRHTGWVVSEIHHGISACMDGWGSAMNQSPFLTLVTLKNPKGKDNNRYTAISMSL